MYGLEKEEIKRRRYLLKEMIHKYARKHYDARIMLPEFKKLTDWLNSQGCKMEVVDYCTEQYWSNPLSYDRQSSNKNPIIGIKDGLLIRERTNNPPKPKKIQQPQPIQEVQTIQKQQEEPQSNYYKISISWTESSDSNKPCLEKVIKFFEELGLDKMEQNSWEAGTGSEHQISYKFEGNDDGFTMLKRSSMVLLDILNEGNNFNIAIHGRKL